MNSILSANEGGYLLLAFCLLMAGIIAPSIYRNKETASTFLVADRKLGLFRSAISIAVSWIWAPAIFICSMQAFQNGLPGIFWFTLPNILCFFLFAPFAIAVRKKMPLGYTLPDYIRERYNSDRGVHIASTVVFFGYQLGAVVINGVAGATLLNLMTGMPYTTALLSIVGLALAYSLLGGLRASVLTDLLQYGMIIFLALVIVPACLLQIDSWSIISDGLGGIKNLHRSLFDPQIAFSLGIPLTLGLLAGPFSDQMFFQRSFAVAEHNIGRTFIIGGLLFGIVPVVLSLLGFIGAGMVQQGTLQVSDPQMVGPLVISALLPTVFLYGFCLMAFAGLCSTIDSSLCAVSSLFSIDVYRRYINPEASDQAILNTSRLAMAVFALLGIAIGTMQPKLLWIFLIYGALASAGMFPFMLSILSRRVTAKGLTYGIAAGLILGLPLSVYANVMENNTLIVTAAVLSVLPGLIVPIIMMRGMKKG